MQFGSGATEVAAHLQAWNVGAFADHSDGDNPAASTLPERIDHLLRIRGFVGHEAATLTPSIQGLDNLLGVLNISGNDQAGCIRLDLAKIIELAAAKIE